MAFVNLGLCRQIPAAASSSRCQLKCSRIWLTIPKSTKWLFLSTFGTTPSLYASKYDTPDFLSSIFHPLMRLSLRFCFSENFKSKKFASQKQIIQTVTVFAINYRCTVCATFKGAFSHGSPSLFLHMCLEVSLSPSPFFPFFLQVKTSAELTNDCVTNRHLSQLATLDDKTLRV